MTERRDWILTFTGRRVFPLYLRPADVSLVDIAHSLAQQVRFTGHCLEPYTIAQHSVLVSMYVEPQFALWGLLHDASEAYLHDIAAPIKCVPEFAFYRDAEAQAQESIAKHFGLTWPEPENVKHVDRRMLATEWRDIMPDAARAIQIDAEPFYRRIQVWPHRVAEQLFRERFMTIATNPDAARAQSEAYQS